MLDPAVLPSMVGKTIAKVYAYAKFVVIEFTDGSGVAVESACEQNWGFTVAEAPEFRFLLFGEKENAK